ncbi:hypothetical protein [Flavobacterium sangjuense]|uniref:Lipoprotein n=1 Tax=Flavobacterium sangjuense TaxID=2518177 RepID=A0A4P7PT30_9FLAO|nr:hypothetical protein [Flavobacterium sangjuense]QBZ98097.1 hypothetical protein GS03_01602 [Flavobacterium sangjuense]
MRKSIVLLLIIALVSCQNKETETIVKPVEETLQTSDLYSKVFYISPKLNTEDCIAYNDGCDCCDGKIVFLKNGTFISDFYCIPLKSYNTGTFKIENKKLILDYDDKEVTYGPANDDYSEEEESVLTLDTVKCGMVSLDVIKCKKKYVFKGESDYYSEDKKASFLQAINEYKNEGAWKLLDVKY